MSALPRRLGSLQSAEERARWRIVKLDSMTALPGEIIAADVETGAVTMRERGPDKIEDGVVKPSFTDTTYSFGPGAIAIVGRR